VNEKCWSHQVTHFGSPEGGELSVGAKPKSGIGVISAGPNHAEGQWSLSMLETVGRFVIGGVVVSAFAIVGGLFRPTSFGGLFGAAPSVALATLGLAILKEGKDYASVECRSMMAGAVALGVYSLVVTQLLMRLRLSTSNATLSAMLIWFVTAFGLWLIFLR
jgi:vacuolar-type H+-ATPase subunit I/STV1